MTRRHTRPVLLLCVLALSVAGLLGLPGGTVGAQGGITEGDLDENGGHYCTQGDFDAGRCPAPNQYFCYTQACDPNNAPSPDGDTTTTSVPDAEPPGSPGVNTTTNGARVDLTANTEPEARVDVRLEDGTQVAQGTAGADGVAFLGFDLAAGDYILLVTATDKAGNSSEPTLHSVSVAGPPPDVPGVTVRAGSADDNDTYLDLTGQPASGYKLEVRSGDSVVKEASGSLDGDGRATASALLVDGGYSFSARLRNGSGESGDSSGDFGVQIGAPPPPTMLLASEPGATPITLDIEGPKKGTASVGAALEGADPVETSIDFDSDGTATAVLEVESDGAWSVTAAGVDFQDQSSEPAVFEDVVVDTQGPLLELKSLSTPEGTFGYLVKTDVGSAVMVESDTEELRTDFVAETDETEFEVEVPTGDVSIAVTALDEFGNESFDTLSHDPDGGGGPPVLPLILGAIIIAFGVVGVLKRTEIRDWWYNRQYH